MPGVRSRRPGDWQAIWIVGGEAVDLDVAVPSALRLARCQALRSLRGVFACRRAQSQAAPYIPANGRGADSYGWGQSRSDSVQRRLEEA